MHQLDRHAKPARQVAREVDGANDNVSAARAADVIVLSTKPQVFPAILPELAPSSARTSW